MRAHNDNLGDRPVDVGEIVDPDFEDACWGEPCDAWEGIPCANPKHSPYREDEDD